MLFLKDLAANNDRQWLKCTSTDLVVLPSGRVTQAEPFDARCCPAIAFMASVWHHTLADTASVHDPDYRVAMQDFNTFIERVSEKIIEADELIPELPVKDVVSRDAVFNHVIN
jgi:hypothetical protein